MTTLMAAFRRDESGATSIEYAFIASLVSILIIGGAVSIGTKLKGYFVTVSGNLN